MTKSRVADLALGSNLGDRTAHLQRAINGLDRHPEIDVVASSQVYETEPIGPDQPDFLNAVIEVETTLSERIFCSPARSKKTWRDGCAWSVGAHERSTLTSYISATRRSTRPT